MELSHIHIYCRELQPAVEFFTDGLGGKLLVRRQMMGKPGAEIDFCGLPLFLREMGKNLGRQYYDSNTGGYNHIGVFVERIEDWLPALEKIPGVTVHGQPTLVPGSNVRNLYISGPSGICVELHDRLGEQA